MGPILKSVSADLRYGFLFLLPCAMLTSQILQCCGGEEDGWASNWDPHAVHIGSSLVYISLLQGCENDARVWYEKEVLQP